MLESEVAPARRRTWWIVALALAVVATVGLTLVASFALAPDQAQSVVPIIVRTPELLPQSVDPRPGIDEPIDYIAAASDAPVIAVASAKHIWISRDDGATFTPALNDVGGELYDLTVDPVGQVYAFWGDNKIWRSAQGRGGVDTIEFTLASTDLSGHEHWRPASEQIAAPLDARGGWIVGTSFTVIGRNGGESWIRPSASASKWHVWRSSLDNMHTARFFASIRDAPESCQDCGRGFALLVAPEGKEPRPVWSMLDHTAIMTDELPHNHLACVGFAGSTLYLVARETHGPRLIAVSGDGKPIHKGALAENLPADVTCTIAGNDRAAYMALGDDIMQIDTDELRVAPAGAIASRGPHERDVLAVDAHGYLLYVADGCVWRYTGSGARHRHQVVCAPRR